MSETNFSLPLVPLRGMVVFPKVEVRLDIGRDKSIRAVEEAMANERLLAVSAQLDDEVENPTQKDIAEVGTIVKIKQMLRLPGGLVRILVEGIARAKVVDIDESGVYYRATMETLVSQYDDHVEIEAYRRLAQSNFLKWAEETKLVTEDEIRRVMERTDASETADQIVQFLQTELVTRQSFLSELNVLRRLNMVVGALNMELQISDLENSINNQVRQQMEKAQKEYFLREKIRVIHNELGDKSDPDEEAEELREQLKKINVSDEVRERIEKEISRYSRMPSMMPEANILRNYLDWVLSLPWDKVSEDRLDIGEAAKILDHDHYGLKKVKERILEFLAVRKLSDSLSGSILCLVGPPGVGKTSLATSIAKAMNRKFIRASLGGVRDEAEIRGHRRTYIGALPGRMIQGLKNAGTRNPVFLLDEIDKLASDYKAILRPHYWKCSILSRTRRSAIILLKFRLTSPMYSGLRRPMYRAIFRHL